MSYIKSYSEESQLLVERGWVRWGEGVWRNEYGQLIVECECEDVCPTKRAVDLRESAASEGESTSEVNLVGGAVSTPPANH